MAENYFVPSLTNFRHRDPSGNVEPARTLADLAPGLCHELSNPLSYVLANLELLCSEIEETDLLPEQREDMLQLCRDGLDGAVRIRALINELRDSNRR